MIAAAKLFIILAAVAAFAVVALFEYLPQGRSYLVTQCSGLTAAMSLWIGCRLTQAGHVRHEYVMFILPNSLGGHQLSTAYHALRLCQRVFCTTHASAVRVYGIALYLWFTSKMINTWKRAEIISLRARA